MKWTYPCLWSTVTRWGTINNLLLLLFGSPVLCPSQALKEQVSSLQAQIKEQEVKVKAAAPDKKQLGDLEKKVNAYRKGQYRFTSAIEWLQPTSWLFRQFFLFLFVFAVWNKDLLKTSESMSMLGDMIGVRRRYVVGWGGGGQVKKKNI